MKLARIGFRMLLATAAAGRRTPSGNPASGPGAYGGDASMNAQSRQGAVATGELVGYTPTRLSGLLEMG